MFNAFSLAGVEFCCPHDLCMGMYCCTPGESVCTSFGCAPLGFVIGDPHISLPGLLPPNQTDVTDFTFDFHGSAGNAYCMITNAAITVNAHMFSLAPTALVPEHRYHGGRCFQFTCIDGIGFVYRNRQGRTQRIAVRLDRTLTDVSVHPFNVTFEDEPVRTSEDAAWTSPDGIAKVGRTAVPDQLVVSLDGLLEVEVSRAEDAELRDQPEGPPVRYINLAVKGLPVGPGVHGFMGQMYAPGAVEARLKMATQAYDRFSTAARSKAPGLIGASRKLRSSASQKKESLACSYSGTSFVCK
ncbi:hypothetical protein KFL_000410080 [Klebsormidium nitens]|uniref:Uncharacterized protein n=1 Tax=Klebsormidium nitens TaxID=105231 RepID=A0A1Y1HRW2_KLENI|nr:hypothetical protein KFL_000410080 [Klebsormidium nitens]|eukprot:GAQ79909.1 hypothetical protein KFL_000410080 [Klebsormidium nitens]